jgi:hypothetical protein
MVPITIQLLFCHNYSHSYPTIILPNEQHYCNLPQTIAQAKNNLIPTFFGITSIDAMLEGHAAKTEIFQKRSL